MAPPTHSLSSRGGPFGNNVAVNPITNEIYAADGSHVTMIDGATNSATVIGTVSGVASGWSPIALNPVTNTVYVLGNAGVTVISGGISGSAPPVPLEVAITPMPNDQTTSSTPTFSFTVTNNLTFAPADNLLYQIDTVEGPWTPAASQGSGVFTGSTIPLQPGPHTLYAYATDGEEATSASAPTSIGYVNANPLTGAIASYQFTVLSTGKIPETVSFTGAPSTAPYGSTFTVIATTNASVPATITASGACNVVGNQVTINSGIGTCSLIATWPGDNTYLPAMASQSVAATKATTTTTTPNLTFPFPVSGTYFTLTASVTSPGGPVNEGMVGFLAEGLLGGSAPVVNGAASLSNFTYPPFGIITISVMFSGGPDFLPSSGSAVAIITSYKGALAFVPVTPCRLADTRNPSGPFGGPELAGGTSRDFIVPNSACGIPANAAAYSLNVTVVPDGPLNYLTVWPSDSSQPLVSILNSDGRIKANAAVVQAGTNGGVSVYASDNTQVILDINGYFVPVGFPPALAFYTLGPCRVVDTRQGGAFGASLSAGETRVFPLVSGNCNIPSGAQAYFLNITAIPHNTLGYLTTWPTGQPQPFVSTLNAPTGAITANAAMVPAGTNGEISLYVTDSTDLIIDINGYFGPPSTNAPITKNSLWLYPFSPCRALDTRLSSGPLSGTVQVENYCGLPWNYNAQAAYVLNATVVPPGSLTYLTIWPNNEPQPVVSTLNALDGAITSNLALGVVTSPVSPVNFFASNPTQLILDIYGLFAP